MSYKINISWIVLVLGSNLCTLSTQAQDTLSNRNALGAGPIDDKALQKLGDKYSGLERTVDVQTMKLLAKMEKRENALQSKMALKDSIAARQMFVEAKAKYAAFTTALQSPQTKLIPRPLQEYIPRLDSLQTAMHFLGQGGSLPGISLSQLQQIQAVGGQLTQLQGRLQQAGEIQDFVRQREQQLKDQLMQNGMAKQLTGMNKDIYYYQQSLSNYRQLLNDKEKLEETALGLVRQLPVFQSFMQKNSYLGQLFPMPQNYGTPQALAGVPTSTDVGNMIAEKIGAAGTKIDPQQYLQDQAQAGHDQLSILKAKVAQAGGGSSDMELPQFNPNNQKTKSFLKRLEFGFNVQSQQSTTLLPVTSDIAGTVGYRISDKVTAGVGVAYKLGWGSGINHIALSNQGLGLRSFLDVKAKGSIWITGGFEYNYMQEFTKWADVRNLDVWQKSALLGLTKKYKSANLQLLYDLLAPYETPRGSVLKFRIGYVWR